MNEYLEYKNRNRNFNTYFVVLGFIFFWLFVLMIVLAIFFGSGMYKDDFKFQMDAKSIILATSLAFVAIPVLHAVGATYDGGFVFRFNVQIGRQLTCQKYLVKSKDNRLVSYYNILNYYYWAPLDYYKSIPASKWMYSIFYNLDNVQNEIDAAQTLAQQYPMYDQTFIINILASKLFIEDVIRINKTYRSSSKFFACFKRFFSWGRILLLFFGQKYFNNKEQFDYESYRQVMVSRYSQFGLTPEILDFIHSERVKIG